jgi:large subunit ribosomal protein L4
VIFGPVVRDHGYSLPKKVRRLGMISALAARMAENKVTILDSFDLDSGKTRDVVGKIGATSVLMIGGEAIANNLRNAISNLHHVNVLPGQGANVYDILRHDRLILSREGAAYLEQRLLAR